VLGLVAEALAVAVLVLAGLVQGVRLARRRDRGIEVEHLTTRVSLWSDEDENENAGHGAVHSSRCSEPYTRIHYAVIRRVIGWPYGLHGLEWCGVDVDPTAVGGLGDGLENLRLGGRGQGGGGLLRQGHGGLRKK